MVDHEGQGGSLISFGEVVALKDWKGRAALRLYVASSQRVVVAAPELIEQGVSSVLEELDA